MSPTLRRAAALTLLTLSLPFGLGACARGTALPPASTATDGPVNLQLVSDIPIPGGATMDNDRSLILSDRDRWTGRVVMTLDHSADEVTAFYQAQMPTFGWQPVMSVTADLSVLTYLRGDRAATVQIERRTLTGSRVSVTVAPRQSQAGGGTETTAAPAAAPRASSSGRIQSETLPPPRR